MGELKVVVFDIKPDIIALCETWTHGEHTRAFLTIPDYNIICRHDRNDTSNGVGGGLLLYAKNGLALVEEQTNVISNFNQSCSVKIPLINGSSLSFVLVYRPHNLYTDEVTVLENNHRLCNLMKSVQKPNVIAGDFNFSDVNWITMQGEAHSQEFVSSVQDCFLTQHVDFPTRISSGTMPDLVFSSDANLIQSIDQIGQLGSSDHSMLLITVAATPPRSVSTEEIPDWKNADFNKLHQLLSNVNWDAEIHGMGTEDSWNMFKSIIQNAEKECVPMRRRRNPNRPLWMTANAMRVVRKKRRLWKKYKTTSDYADYMSYKAIEKKVKGTIRRAKKTLERKIAKNAKKNPKEFYAYLKSCTANRETVGPLKENGTTINDDEQMTNVLNTFFTSVFTREDLSNIPQPKQTYFGNSPLTSVLFPHDRIKDKIDKMKSTAAPGDDNITPRLLQSIEDIICVPLSIIFAQSLNEGIVPEDWRRANITPVFKKGSKANAGNYRPISLTSIICKIMESIIRDSIVHHLATNKLVRPSQHGFMAHKSCLTNLLEYLETLTKLVDEGHSIDIIYCDFAKAFDKVPHQRLLQVLRSHGIDGKVLNWISAWLSNRSQRVILNGSASEWSDVLSGVPQGSVLGPTLFIIFINNLDEAMDIATGIISKFADDTKMGRTISGEDDRNALQRDIDSLLKWADVWQAQFNATKCKVMHIGRKNPQFKYTMGDKVLQAVDVEKDVGVMIHSSLKPSTQCAQAAKKANQIIGRMSRAFHYRDKDVWVRLYKQYVRPHLEYCVQAWSPWTVADIDVLENVQKRVVRMVSGLQSSSYEDRLKELGLPSLSQRRKRGDMLETWKILNGFEDVDPTHWYQLASTPTYATRHSIAHLQLVKPPARLDLRSNFFSVRCVNAWNALPVDVRSANSINDFKNLYDKQT